MYLVIRTSLLLCFVFNVAIVFGYNARKKCNETAVNYIYCEGPILKMIQESKIFDDDKTFIDMPMRYDFDTVYESYLNKTNKGSRRMTRPETISFVRENFEPIGTEYEKYEPTDWREYPNFLLTIDDPEYRKWAQYIHGMWPSLTRKIKDDVKLNKQRYSLMHLPHPYIIPGGRFREMRYWDSYWILKGLLHSGMINTARGMLLNFAYLINTTGHIPIGNRVYYLDRSQMPIFTYMVKDYIEATADYGFIREHLDEMIYEIGGNYANCFQTFPHDPPLPGEKPIYLSCYYIDSHQQKLPRPESYNVDMEIANLITDEKRRNKFFCSQRTISQSMWDMSSRWFDNITEAGDPAENVSYFGTSNMNNRGLFIDLVDMSSLMYGAFSNAVFYGKLADMEDSNEQFKDFMRLLLIANKKILWNEEKGIWSDSEAYGGPKRAFYFLSHIMPLYTDFYDMDKTEVYKKVVGYLKSKGVFDFVGGVPVSLFQSGELWDFPNVWPCYQYLLIMSLRKSPRQEDRDLARDEARKFLESAYHAYINTGWMFERYDATKIGTEGTGGDYSTQYGFGPTNGMILDLLVTYGSEIFRYDVVPRSGLTPSIKDSAIICYLNNTLLIIIICFQLYFRVINNE